MMRCVRIALPVLLIVVVSACSGSQAGPAAVDVASENVSAAPTLPATAGVQAAETTPLHPALPEATATDLPDAEPGPKPTPRPVMEASPPDSVQLASGKVQLVEFFAFW